MRKSALFASILLLAGCGAAPIARGPVVVTSDGKVTETPIAKDPALTDTGTTPRTTQNTTGAWVGVAPESDVLAAGDGTASLALWIDAPQSRPRVHVPMDVSLVIDTSGSMAGAKIENARRAANLLVDDLSDGDIVSIVSFNDDARTIVEPTALSARRNHFS